MEENRSLSDKEKYKAKYDGPAIVPLETKTKEENKQDIEIGPISSEEDLRKEYVKFAPSALHTIIDTMLNGTNEKTKVYAANSLLDKIMPSQINWKIESFMYKKIEEKKEILINFLNKHQKDGKIQVIDVGK